MKTKQIRFASLLLMSLVSSAQASGGVWDGAVSTSSLSQETLFAIALTESGRNGRPQPFVLRFGDQAHYYTDHAQAVDALEAAMEMGELSIDIGAMQVNLKYHAHRVNDPVQLLEPAVNLKVASEILAECRHRYGADALHQILACYHVGPNPDNEPARRLRGLKYAEKVLRTALSVRREGANNE